MAKKKKAAKKATKKKATKKKKIQFDFSSNKKSPLYRGFFIYARIANICLY